MRVPSLMFVSDQTVMHYTDTNNIDTAPVLSWVQSCIDTINPVTTTPWWTTPTTPSPWWTTWTPPITIKTTTSTTTTTTTTTTSTTLDPILCSASQFR